MIPQELMEACTVQKEEQKNDLHFFGLQKKKKKTSEEC